MIFAAKGNRKYTHLNPKSTFLSFSLILGISILWGCDQKERKVSIDENTVISYLDNNSFALSTSDSKPFDLSPLDDSFKRKRIILLGEVHGSQINEKLDLEIFKYLYQKHGVRHYLGESGYGMGLLINEYIQTGDEQLLKSIFQLWSGTFSGTQQNYERIKALRAFNVSLPSYAKFKYVGIDLEQQFGAGFLAIKRFLFDDLNYYDKSIRQALASFVSFQNNNFNSVNAYCQYFLQQIRKESLVESYKRAFGKHYQEVELILENMIMRHALHQNPKSYIAKRENQITENLDFIMNQDPIGNFYGKWGAFHIWKNNVGNQPSSFIKLAIKRGVINKDDVLSIPIFYSNSYYADKNSDFRSTSISSMAFPENLTSNETSSIKFYRLNEESSPFLEHMLLIEGEEGVVTDYFTEFIKISGSKAATRLIF
ncbi:TraB/GumN family protein [Roseivirga misakiensis]|uniref:hypothetical protein n=1 Tax=Roseivirga misakiensis TaxID=1563681 RepID=UPI00159F0F36|nr:hypothetical protein [Roseivirga misakiensis]